MVRWLRFCALNAGARFDLRLANTRDPQVLFSPPIISDSLLPHGLQYTSLPVPYHLQEFAQVHAHFIGDAIQPSHPLMLSSPSASASSPPASASSPPSPSQYFPASGTFPMSQLFTSGDQNTGASASALVLPMNTQG